MPKPLITSTSNPLIKQARALRQKKARADSGCFLVEGIHHVGEAVEAGWEVEYDPVCTRLADQRIRARFDFPPRVSHLSLFLPKS